MDYEYLMNGDKIPSPPKSYQINSISNSNLYIRRDPCDVFNRDYEELSKLFEQEYKDISRHRTDELSKGLKSIREKEIYSTLNENINEKIKIRYILMKKKIYFQKTHFKKNMKIRKEMMK